jgi:hypothetical protein
MQGEAAGGAAHPEPVQLLASHVYRGAPWLFGRDAAGGSVAVRVTDARAYLWVAQPPDAEALVRRVNVAVAAARPASFRGDAEDAVCARETRSWRTFFGYDPEQKPFLKLEIRDPRDSRAVREALAQEAAEKRARGESRATTRVVRSRGG